MKLSYKNRAWRVTPQLGFLFPPKKHEFVLCRDRLWRDREGDGAQLNAWEKGGGNEWQDLSSLSLFFVYFIYDGLYAY